MTAYDTNKFGDDAQCDWVALRYVLGELSDVEASEFEDQLLRDEDARERLVEAVRLLEAVGTLRGPVVSRARFGRFQAAKVLRYVGMTIAAAVLIVVGFWASKDEPKVRGVVQEAATESTDVESEQLVALWAESSSSLETSTETDLGDEVVMETSASFLPPDWMLAAVEQEMRSAPSSEDPFDADDNTIERN